MLNLKSFYNFLIEGTSLTPAELKKTASGGPNMGVTRIDILANKIRKQQPLTLAKKGGEFLVLDVNAALDSVEQFKKDNKPFQLIGAKGKEIRLIFLKHQSLVEEQEQVEEPQVQQLENQHSVYGWRQCLTSATRCQLKALPIKF